jgi:hypothetical protein
MCVSFGFFDYRTPKCLCFMFSSVFQLRLCLDSVFVCLWYCSRRVSWSLVYPVWVAVTLLAKFAGSSKEVRKS